MNECESILGQIAFYLDDELQGCERERFEAHVELCDGCRAAFESERRFLENVRGSRPLYAAPPEVRADIEKILSSTPAPHLASPQLRRRVGRSLAEAASTFRGGPRRRALAAVVTIIIIGFSIWIITRSRSSLNPSQPSEFAMMAVNTHQRHQRGHLPLEIERDSPQAISEWFDGKVSFHLKLPNYQESSGQERLYELEGARLVAFKNDYAAYVAYRMGARPISLVVTSNSVALPSGGEEIVSKGLTFHYDSIEGLKVITWTDRGLTYALVSDLDERGQQSCIVCHAGVKDRDFIEGLRPK
ncbi:MAG TPA: zf-HC2 domain-containing protein [Blastocatellia bacterium]|nr:zf-HC2 domain-containing protein [Blastocatellia bacterium]